MTNKPASRAEYLAGLPRNQRETVEQLLATVHAAAPDAEEAFSYGMPGYKLGGRPLAWVAAWKHHYSMYPVSVAQVEAVAEPGEVYEAEKGTLRFSADAPLPYDLVARLVKARVSEITKA